MPDRQSRWGLPAIALLMIAAATVALTVAPPASDPPLPSDSAVLASRLAAHPTDWLATCALTERALDSSSPQRFALWHAAHAHAQLLAPNRPEPQEAFARSGFFHWNELSATDRQAVLAAEEPLLRNPPTFFSMARPLFELTGDLTMLRRGQPHTDQSINFLMNLAAMNGRFDDYRALRAELQKKQLDDFLAIINTASPRDLIQAFPQPPYRKDSEPLITALLRELHDRPLDEDPARPQVTEGIADYALRHDLVPLDGMEVLVRREGSASVSTRLLLARKLGVPTTEIEIEMSRRPPVAEPPAGQWRGLCDGFVCDPTWREIATSHAIVLSLAPAASDAVPAYVEIYVDDALAAEGEIAAARSFALDTTPGNHRLEVRVSNPVTRNGERRRIRIGSLTTS